MKLSKTDIEAILVLSDILPCATADELVKILEKFRGSVYDQPQYDLYSCLSRYVNFILSVGLGAEDLE